MLLLMFDSDQFLSFTQVAVVVVAAAAAAAVVVVV